MKVGSALFFNICKTLCWDIFLKEELYFQRAIGMACLNPSFSISINVLSNRTSAKALVLHKRNIIFAKLHLHYEDNNGLFALSTHQCQAHQTSKIMHDIKYLLFHFWAMETHLNPTKKYICQKRIGQNAWLRHLVHLFNLT